jgi:HEAT repeat protein
VAALDDGDAFLRSVAAMALARVESPAAVRPLLTHLSDPDQRVRRSVAQALSHITKSEKFFLFEDLTPEQLRALRKAIDSRDGSSG